MKPKNNKGHLAPKSIDQVYEAILVKTYKLGDIKDKHAAPGEDALTSRNLKYWMDEGLFLIKRNDEYSWTRFSFADYVWVKMLLYMHSLEVTKKKKVTLIKKCLAKLPQPTSIPNLSIDALKSLQEKDGAINEEMAALAKLVTDRIWDKGMLYIRLYSDDTCQFTDGQAMICSSFLTEEQLIDTASQPDSYIQISLKSIFTDFVYTMIMAGNGREPVGLGILTNQEGTLLQHLDDGILTKVDIKLLDDEEVGLVVNDQSKVAIAHFLSTYMVQGEYQHITYETTGGEKTTFSKGPIRFIPEQQND
jgi:DNA-binding transcriptional MerR regulator